MTSGKLVNQNKLQKRPATAIKEKGQYFIAFGVIATMLMVAGFPMFVILFFGIFAFFLWRTFASPSRGETRDIFEFYLAANDILRDDDRRWYGFEIQEVISRGERILQLMSGAPPLIYFTLGALYQKAGDHKSAVNHLSYIIENENSDESTYAYPSPDLRNYVKVLRKIEREPHEAPLTAASVRSLERARRTRGKALLETSRAAIIEQKRLKQELRLEQKKNSGELSEKTEENVFMQTVMPEEPEHQPEMSAGSRPRFQSDESEHENGQRKKGKKEETNPYANRKPISEVLHDIYDKNIQ